MKSFTFTVVATGINPEADQIADRFYEAGCDDATVTFQKGAVIVDFNREAHSFRSAVLSAIADVETAGARVVHVEPDHLVSLSDIAARIGLTRAAVSNYARGERGRDFPAPIARVTTDMPLWDWFEVARWLYQQGRLSVEEVIAARVVRQVNAILDPPARG